nr:MAG TPA: hypothetical protein [Bacteriophage sp.]
MKAQCRKSENRYFAIGNIKNPLWLNIMNNKWHCLISHKIG